jgi:dihydrofolate reductase
MRKFHIIAGVSKNNGIGFENRIPWKVSEDMKFFKDVTTSVDNPNQINAVIMGRNTFESLHLWTFKTPILISINIFLH